MCEPFPRSVNCFGLVHAANALLSRLHSKVAAESVSVKANVALVALDGLSGCWVMVGCGGAGALIDHV